MGIREYRSARFPHLRITTGLESTGSDYEDDEQYFVDVKHGDEWVGLLTIQPCSPGGYAPIMQADIEDAYRGMGLYPEMLMAGLEEVKAAGCKGLVSHATGRIGVKSSASWAKFAKREKRVREMRSPYRPESFDYYLSGTFGGFARGWRR